MRPQRSLRRAVPTRSSKRKFIIYSEGKNTEPHYFRTVGRVLLGALIDLEIIDAAGVPMTIAEAACKRAAILKRGHGRKSSFEEGDQVWAVFDRDEHPKVAQALERCRTGNVGIAYSNPCFELWLILHFNNFDRPDDHHQVQAALAGVCKEYDPDASKSADFTKFMLTLEEAEERAAKQLERREAEGLPIRRPFTTVFRLTREMRNAHNAYTGQN